MVSTRKRAAIQPDDEAPEEVKAHTAKEAHQHAAQARAAAAEQVAARKRARAAQKPVAKKTVKEDEAVDTAAALDVLPDDVLAAVAGHNGFLLPAAGVRTTPTNAHHQPLHITHRARALERKAGPVNVKVGVVVLVYSCCHYCIIPVVIIVLFLLSLLYYSCCHYCIIPVVIIVLFLLSLLYYSCCHYCCCCGRDRVCPCFGIHHDRHIHSI